MFARILLLLHTFNDAVTQAEKVAQSVLPQVSHRQHGMVEDVAKS